MKDDSVFYPIAPALSGGDCYFMLCRRHNSADLRTSSHRGSIVDHDAKSMGGALGGEHSNIIPFRKRASAQQNQSGPGGEAA